MQAAPVRITAEEMLSDNWYLLKKYSFDLQRRDGSWQAQTREVYDRGNGATILLYNRERRTVLLIRQFRMPTYVNDHSGYLIETAAGLLDNASPEARIRLEAEEETGYRVGAVEKVYEAFMSPGSVTERLHFFIGEYSPTTAPATVAAWKKRARTSRCWSWVTSRRWTWCAAARSSTARPSCSCNTWSCA